MYRHTLKIFICNILLLAAIFSTWRLDSLGSNQITYSLLNLFFIYTLISFFNLYDYSLLTRISAFLISVQLSLSLGSHAIYGSSFSTDFALSIINTNITELCSMLQLLTIGILIFIALYYVSFISLSSFKRPKKFILALSLLSFIAFSYGNYSHINSKSRAGADNQPISRILHRSFFYNFESFSDSIYSINSWNDKAIKIPHSYSTSRDFHKTIVILIGESVSKDKMSIYGYHRKTTPYLESIKNELILFNKAVSPAAYTVLSVPLAISNNKVPHKNYDSIIDVAKDIGYQTYWISTQPKSGIHNNPISKIALQSNYSRWISGPDTLLVNELKYVISDNSKKLIFLHMNGSHEPVCESLNNINHFKGNDPQDDCYDNTVKSTDEIIRSIISNLQEGAVFIYFSDHGLIKHNGQYVHAGGVPPKRVVEVPMLLWSKSHLPKIKHIRSFNEPYSLMHNYHLFANLMGARVDNSDCISPIINCLLPSPIVIDAKGTLYDYNDLPP